MELSIFLAKLLGIYLIIIALDMLFRIREVEASVKDFASSKGLIAFSGSTSIFVGLIIILMHPFYDWNWMGLITILGWLLVIRGIMRFLCPTYMHKRLVPLFHGRYWLIGLILLIIGIYLAYMGFTACHCPRSM